MALTVSGVDYSWARPDPATMKGKGVKYALRYLAHDSNQTHGKILFQPELDRLWAAGIGVGVVWESGAQRALGGRAAGAADAAAAEAQAKSLGLDGIPVYFAVDWDATDAQKPAIADYMRGAEDALGHDRVGVYGGYWVVKYLAEHGVCSYYWQTLAWSGGLVHPKVHIYQRHNGVSIAGGECDVDVATSAADFGVRLKGNASFGPDHGPGNSKLAVWMAHLKQARDMAKLVGWTKELRAYARHLKALIAREQAKQH